MPEKAVRCKVEPYVIAADICNTSLHTGMGGWTGDTDSSGWLYRQGIEAILGISQVDNALRIDPCIPRNWPGFYVNYRFESTHYRVTVENPNGINRSIRKILLDGSTLPGNLIPLVVDGQPHEVQMVMG
jgi:cyclic beta-1,2-glucan synthetase